MTSNLSGRGGRNSDLRALEQRCFHEGVAEFLAGMPLREIGCVADQVYYEYGRLFAARLVALGYAVPKLPTRGDFRRADFRAALDAFHQAMIVDDTFPSPFLGLFRQAREAAWQDDVNTRSASAARARSRIDRVKAARGAIIAMFGVRNCLTPMRSTSALAFSICKVRFSPILMGIAYSQGFFAAEQPAFPSYAQRSCVWIKRRRPRHMLKSS